MNKAIDKMILEGVIEVVGLDPESGEFLYSFTPKLKDFYPDLYNELQTYVSKEIMELWQKGFVSMDVTDPNPIITLTNKAFIEEEVQRLDYTLKHSLSEIKRMTV